MTPKECPLCLCLSTKQIPVVPDIFLRFWRLCLSKTSRSVTEHTWDIPRSSDPTSWGWSYVPFRRIWIHLNPKSSELRCFFFLPTTLLKISFFLKECPATKLSSGMTSPNIANLSDFSSRNFRGTLSHPHLHRRTRPEKDCQKREETTPSAFVEKDFCQRTWWIRW